MTMLIRNEQENNQIQRSSPRGVCCALCGQEVNFPRIQAADMNSNVYHVTCASTLAHTLLSEINAYLLENHAE